MSVENSRKLLGKREDVYQTFVESYSITISIYKPTGGAFLTDNKLSSQLNFHLVI